MPERAEQAARDLRLTPPRQVPSHYDGTYTPPARPVSRLTTAQRRALTTLDGNRSWPVAAARPLQEQRKERRISPQVARALILNGWATCVCRVDQEGLIFTATDRLVDPGRLTITADGRAELHVPVVDRPEFLTDAGSVAFRTRPRAVPRGLGRWVVDDDIDDEDRGWKQELLGYIEGSSTDVGLTTSAGRASRSSGDAERQEPEDLHPSWKRAAKEAHAEARPRHDRGATRALRRAS